MIINIELDEEQQKKLDYIADDLALEIDEILSQQIFEYIESYDYE